MGKYTIHLSTPRMASAGTNADVEGRILGTRGSSAWRVLDNPGDDREQGSEDFYRLDFEDNFGDVAGLELRVKKSDEDNPNWYLSTAFIAKVENKDLFELPFHNWITPTSPVSWVHATLSSVKFVGKINYPNALGIPSPYIW